jgi:hypothetical protein
MYVSVLALGNLGGRLGWSVVSDKIGRRKTFQLFTLGSIPLFVKKDIFFRLTPFYLVNNISPPRYLSLPFLVQMAVTSPSIVPGATFVLTTALAVSMMGGSYAVMPAYEADMFGTKSVQYSGLEFFFSFLFSPLGAHLVSSLPYLQQVHGGYARVHAAGFVCGCVGGAIDDLEPALIGVDLGHHRPAYQSGPRAL